MADNKIVFRNNTSRSEALSADQDNLYFPTDSNTIITQGKEWGVSVVELTTTSVGSSVTWQSSFYTYNGIVVKPTFVTYNGTQWMLIGTTMCVSTSVTESQPDGYYGPVVYAFTLSNTTATLNSIVDPRSINMYTDSMSWVFDYLGFGAVTDNHSGFLTPTLYSKLSPTPTGAQLEITSSASGGYIILNGVQTEVPVGTTTFSVKAPGDGTTGVKFPREGMKYYKIRFIEGFVISGDTASINFNWRKAFVIGTQSTNTTLHYIVVESGAISGTSTDMSSVLFGLYSVEIYKDTFPHYGKNATYQSFAEGVQHFYKYLYEGIEYGNAIDLNANVETQGISVTMTASSANRAFDNYKDIDLTLTITGSHIDTSTLFATYGKFTLNWKGTFNNLASSSYNIVMNVPRAKSVSSNNIALNLTTRASVFWNQSMGGTEGNYNKVDFTHPDYMIFSGPSRVVDVYKGSILSINIGHVGYPSLISAFSQLQTTGNALLTSSNTYSWPTWVDILLGVRRFDDTLCPANVYDPYEGYTLAEILELHPSEYTRQEVGAFVFAQATSTSTKYSFLGIYSQRLSENTPVFRTSFIDSLFL